MEIKQSRRLEALPPYVFSEINILKAEAIKKGVSLLSLAIGDPDRPTPKAIIEKIQEAALVPSNHMYSPYEGTLAFRRAVKDWFQKRFGVSLDAEKEIVALIGSKEGVAHFPVAFCDPGDKVLYPNPGYPVFETGILLAGGIPVPIPHTRKNGFLPEMNQLESLLKEHRPKFMILNYPCNPTSAVCPKDKLAEMVLLAKKYNTINN
jgi:LL-diaminopimelate aminotransferase